ncbi:MAG: hypothetical protein Q9M19_01870 [Mariprofundaceae bacterium]|nr:hypothetical protein [Mariprofundaceae bacterium]
MKLTLYLVLSMMFTACGYHLVGQGGGSVIPDTVQTAQLDTLDGLEYQALRTELQHRWSQQAHFPALQGETEPSKQHITLRLEQVQISFVAIAFDAAGLAIQYRLQVAGVLNMYQQHALLWGTGRLSVQAEVFAADNPSAIEAERAQLLLTLRQTWANEAIKRLKSGF